MESNATAIDRQCLEINCRRGENVEFVEMNCAMFFNRHLQNT